MTEHECIIGLYGDYDDTRLMTFNELLNTLKSEDEYRKLHTGLCQIDYEWEIADYFDRRKSTNFIQFDYCPVCGKKIDWKKLKKETRK